MKWDEADYRRFFQHLHGVDPYPYQMDVASRLAHRESLVLRAPTGSGKTATVLTPFLYAGWEPKPCRLIYALPLRTLAQSIYRTAQELAKKSGRQPETTVTIQTGEQPDDPFFQRGQVIIATYDQVLSGLLESPYGLPGKLHNVNAAAAAGALVVFDEFHLMEPSRAFLTGAASLYWFRDLAQSVWMTATATPPLVDELSAALGAAAVGPSDEEVAALPCVRGVKRKVVWGGEPLYATAIAGKLDERVVVIANTVSRAQTLYGELTRLRPDVPAVLLHSRFFRADRREKEARIVALFGKESKGPGLLVATQTIEAGADISCDHLFTELAPMNALVQRAGRCARFPGESGVVHIHPLPDEPHAWLPYGDLQGPEPALAATRRLVEEASMLHSFLSPKLAGLWVEEVHGRADGTALGEGWCRRFGTVVAQVRQAAVARDPQGVGHLIRQPDLDQVAVVIAREDNLPARPTEREFLTLNRWALAKLRETGVDRPTLWYWDTSEEGYWRPVSEKAQLLATFAVAISPTLVRYTADVGLEMGQAGVEESPPRVPPSRPGHSVLHAETWQAHSRAVAREAVRRVRWEAEWLADGIVRRYGVPQRGLEQAVETCGLLHDLGKLQGEWQAWAAALQTSRDRSYQHTTALAHTDFDPSDPADRERQRGVGLARPDHSAAGAYLGATLLGTLLVSTPREARAGLASACVAAVLAHHGGWLNGVSAGQDLGLRTLWSGAEREVAALCGAETSRLIAQALVYMDRR
ncbi:MAG: CRISPR-associated helicase Cas3', partial [Chloroflexota bacterium]